MNIIPSKIEFLGYNVKKAIFINQKEGLRDGAEYTLTPKFSRAIQQRSDNEYALSLGLLIEANEEENALPFTIEIIIEGTFRITDVEDKEKSLKVNAVAILFPYIRATLSTFTALMNINPILLPTINLVAMFEENEKECEEKKQQSEN